MKMPINTGHVTAPQIVDIMRVQHAVDLYNTVYDFLIHNGWTEEKKESPFWTDGEPQGTWRHPDHPGSWSMSAAFVALAQLLPKRT